MGSENRLSKGPRERIPVSSYGKEVLQPRVRRDSRGKSATIKIKMLVDLRTHPTFDLLPSSTSCT